MQSPKLPRDPGCTCRRLAHAPLGSNISAGGIMEAQDASEPLARHKQPTVSIKAAA